MTRTRRTLKRYADLFRNPRALFSPGPDNEGVETILWPNGEPVIWLKSGSHGIEIKASRGPAGMGIYIRSFVGSAPISVTGNIAGDLETFVGPDMKYLDLCLYNPDERSQEFKRWYQADAATRERENLSDPLPIGAIAPRVAP